MPNRWIKEAYCASSRINAVGAEARDLWVRLLVNADDHGYFHGGAQLVASACFPLQPNARKCEQLLTELEAGQLIVRYESGGKPYLAITQWYERPRSKPKYPPPPDGKNEACEQLQTGASNRKHLQAIACLHDHDHDHDHDTAASKIALAAGGWSGITDDDRRIWSEAYPAISVDGELARSAAWALANPKNRKSNWKRFITNWMQRAQDNPTPRRANGAAEPPRRID